MMGLRSYKRFSRVGGVRKEFRKGKHISYLEEKMSGSHVNWKNVIYILPIM